jgi:hypothetical protein
MTASQGASGARRNRLYFRGAVVGALLLVIIATGYIVYNVNFKKKTAAAAVSFDLSSLFFQRPTLPPEPANPCIVLQSQIDATRTGNYQAAYDLLATQLKQTISFEQFVKNAKDNQLLLKQISAYDFPAYAAQGDSAFASGYVDYTTGGRSKVEAYFAMENGVWRIARLTIVYD